MKMTLYRVINIFQWDPVARDGYYTTKDFSVRADAEEFYIRCMAAPFSSQAFLVMIAEEYPVVIYDSKGIVA